MDRDEILNQIRIATLIETGEISDANVVTIINQGVYEVAAQDDWPWLQASDDLSLTDSQRTVALPADYDRFVALVDDDHDETIPYMFPDNFFHNVGNDTGNEATKFTAWTIWEQAIYLSPVPEANDSDRLTLYYFKQPTLLSAGGTEPEWPAAWHWALVEYAKWKMWDRMEYFDQSERAKTQYASYVADMKAWYRTRGRRGPYVVGDGREFRVGDPNIPWLWEV